MRVAILENLLRINTVLLFAVGFIAGYQQTMFGREWIEDHAKSEGFVRQGRLSTTAIFSKSLSDRCRRRRVLMWASAFLALMAVQAGILWLRSL
jgi:hypothetical protein